MSRMPRMPKRLRDWIVEQKVAENLGLLDEVKVEALNKTLESTMDPEWADFLEEIQDEADRISNTHPDRQVIRCLWPNDDPQFNAK